MGAAARARGAAMQMAARLTDVIWPAQCLVCDARTMASGAFCPACWQDAPFIRGLGCDACGAPLPGEEDGAVHCDDCRASPRPWARGRSAFVYAGSARRLALALKHADRSDLAAPAAAWMAARSGDLIGPDTVILPVPLHWSRRIARRGNQADWLAAALSRTTGRPWRHDVLRRTRRTPSLGGLDPGARAAALDGAITARPIAAPVLIVDDVMTSGATLAAASRAVLAAGAPRVDVVTLARAVKDA